MRSWRDFDGHTIPSRQVQPVERRVRAKSNGLEFAPRCIARTKVHRAIMGCGVSKLTSNRANYASTKLHLGKVGFFSCNEHLMSDCLITHCFLQKNTIYNSIILEGHYLVSVLVFIILVA